MGNRRLMVLFAALFSIVFSIVYYFLFTMTLTSDEDEKRILYMNQVGLYKQEDSVEKMKQTLKAAGLEGYAFQQDGLTAVVCSVSEKEKTTTADQKKLAELNLSYIVKKVTIDDPDIVKLIDSKQYAKALERIGK